jgi:glutamate-1-semialdehyde aminotransferase
MLNEGIIIDPRGAGCLSTAIGEAEVDDFTSTLKQVLSQLS